MRLKKIVFLGALLSSFSVGAEVVPTDTTIKTELSLNKIMADPDWMGNSPVNPAWSADGSRVFYQQKATGHSHQEHYQYLLSAQQSSLVEADKLLWLASQKAKQNPSGSWGSFVYQGDVYLIDNSTTTIKAITSDDTIQSRVNFIDDNKLSYLEDHQIFIYHIEQGFSEQIADFKLADDPEKKGSKSYLEQSQPRLLKYIEKKEKEKLYQKKRQEKNRLSQSKTWYLGKQVNIRTFQLSPDANWLLLGTTEKSAAGKADHMPEFVTSDGYVNDRKVRPLVGTVKPVNEKFYLINLKSHQKHALDVSNLPGINDDPLDSLKKSAAKKIGYKYKEQDGPRAISAYNWRANGGVEWTNDSQKLALLLYSYDNKDRWIVGVDVNKPKLKTMHWLSNEAWVNDWTFNEFGWLPDNETLYYLSEEDGYSHLYIKKGKRRARQLTEGKYEVSDLTVSKAGAHIYFKANQNHPGNYEIYRVSLKGRNIEALTNLGGVNDYVLSPSEKQLVIRHSTTTKMPELLLSTIDKTEKTAQFTHTASEQFKAIKWNTPEIVAVPSTHISRPIYSRFYQAENETKLGENNKKPAVIFVHGAGYLQNSHQGWSGYFREFMFHNLLTRQGYVVLDMDYRASKGYGRDWRTAIYRNMGTPELEDLTDGAKWLVENANVDPERIGIYGGSYGGFMTFMALFKTPDVFAAGAALRPVTDWAHYNHGYTSNILNTPEIDPEAYERSSPIEFAEGLNKPLLICHGMVDDNVFFKDSVRLVQRLIELEKTQYFETAIYPVEPHGFKQPSSWLDEYTRIYQLFERHLN